ncbi:MAG: DegV family protein [Desulfomicrobium escambiense]|nr:DegV family protein [Desulfomicrobium escambiense]
MQKIGLLIDSTTLTRNDILSHPCVKVAPLNVMIDGVEHRETDITEAQMMEHLHTAKKMTTSQPAPGEFLRLYEEYQREGYTHVLVVLISDKISGTAQSAVIAKGMLEGSLEVEIYPTAVASYGVTNGVMALIADIEAKRTFDQVVARCKALFVDAKVMFTLSNLMNLFRGGRLNRVSALLGTVLRIKPVIEMIGGKLELTRKERTNIACYEHFMESVRAYRAIHRNVSVDVIAINRAEWGQKLTEAIGREFPDIRGPPDRDALAGVLHPSRRPGLRDRHDGRMTDGMEQGFALIGRKPFSMPEALVVGK